MNYSGEIPKPRKWPRKLVLLLMAVLCLASGQALALSLDIGDGAGTVGDTVIIPVSIIDVVEPVYSVEMTISWYWAYATLTDVQTTGTLSESWSMEFNATPGGGQVVLAGGTPLPSGGLLCNLEFRLDAGNGNIAIQLPDALVNEDLVPDELFGGTINVSPMPVIDVYPDQGVIAVGDHLSFTTYSGQAPYTYTSSDPAVANFSTGDNVLQGQGPGFVHVTSEDVHGTTNTTTGVIEVRPFKLWIPDFSATEGQPTLLPVIIADPTSYGVQSAEVELSWYATHATFSRVVTAGSLVQAAGWTEPQVHAESGSVFITTAGSSALPSGGILFFVEFIFDHSVTINVEPGLFNEVYQALPDDGYITVTPLPTLTLSPSFENLLVGDFLALALSGPPTPPVQYFWSDGSVLEVVGDGIISALAAGGADVWAEDALGAVSNTVHFEVYDIALPSLGSSIDDGQTIFIPVKVDRDLDDLGIHSLEIGVSFNSYYAQFLGATSLDSATEDWGQPLAVAEGNLVKVYHAGAQELDGCPGGVVYLEFLGLPTINYPYSGFQYDSALFNENSPRVLLNHGDPCIATPVPLLPPAGQVALSNHPNPFNPGTHIDYRLGAVGGRAVMEVYSARGQLVKVLLDQWLEAGSAGSVYWDGRNMQGQPQASGLYFSKLSVGAQTVMGKMLMLK